MNNSSKFERIIAKCYVFFLPFRMINALTGVFSVFGTEAYYFDFLFLMLGVVAYLIRHKGVVSYRKDSVGAGIIRCFIEAVVICALFSLSMAIYTSYIFGTYNNESSYYAALKMLLNFVQYTIMLVYGRHVLRILSIESVYSAIHKSVRCLLIIGYIQFFIKLGINLNVIYSILQKTINVSKYSGEICLTTSEPSHAAMVLGTIVLPYYLSFFLSNHKTSIKSIFELLLWVPIVLASGSSTVYLICGVEMIISVIWMLFKHNAGVGTRIVSMLLGVLLIIVLANPQIIDKAFEMNFSYLLYNKITDLGNQSTASRYHAFIANVLIFIRFPIIGCGNGLQGYYYQDYSYLISGKNVDRSIIQLFSGTTNGIANGSTFFAGILSGWGIIGTLLFLRFFLKDVNSIVYRREEFGILYYFFFIAFIGVLISGLKSEFVGLPFIWFILSIPMIDYLNDNSEI